MLETSSGRKKSEIVKPIKISKLRMRKLNNLSTNKYPESGIFINNCMNTFTAFEMSVVLTAWYTGTF